MVEIGIALVDKILELLRIKANRRDRYFTEVVKACYEGAKSVKSDYVQTLLEFKDLFEQGRDRQSLAGFLERNRFKGLETRNHLRANLRAGDYQQFTEFEYGVRDLLDGGFSHNQFLQSELALCEAAVGEPSADSTRTSQAQNLFDRTNAEIERIWQKIDSGYESYLRSHLNN